MKKLIFERKKIDSKKLLFERMNIIGGMKEEVINEMPKIKTYPIQQTQEWEDLLNQLKTKYGIRKVGFNLKSDKPFVTIEKTGYYPLGVLSIKPEWLDKKNLAGWLGDHILKNSETAIQHFREKPKQLRRIKKLPPNASVEEKINMIDIIEDRVDVEKLKVTNARDEEWAVQQLYEKYGDYWTSLFEDVKDTPEWEEYTKQQGNVIDYNFGDVLA